MDIANVILVEIDENRVVILDGKEYLVVDRESLGDATKTETSYQARLNYKIPASKTPTPKKPKKRTNQRHDPKLRPAILFIIENHPDIKSGDIRNLLRVDHKITLESHQLRTVMQDMRRKGQIKVSGDKNHAFWSVVESSGTPEWMIPKP